MGSDSTSGTFIGVLLEQSHDFSASSSIKWKCYQQGQWKDLEVMQGE